MEKPPISTQPKEKEEELDLLEIVQILFRKRKTIYKSVGISILFALIIAFSML